ncbi:hypothetical protein BH24ACT22_BH24ACT22_18230 [soil metagenome]
MDTSKNTAPRTTVDEEIRLAAAAHPERTPSEHIEAAERLAAKEYRFSTRRLMDQDMLDACWSGLELDGV